MGRVLLYALLLWGNFLHFTNGYFEGQPKIITENGNLILESAKDKNITVRLVGRGCFNLNELNLLNYVTNRSVISSGSITDELANSRLLSLERRMENIRNRLNGGRGLIARVIRLENETSTTSTSISARPLRNVNRRIARLEQKVDRLMTKLAEDNCDSNPCQNGGTCIDMYDGFICKCPYSWEGLTCTTDVNECAIFAGTDLGCQNNAICMNMLGGYSCTCMQGFFGIHCTRRTVDCLSSTSAEMCDHGSCIHTNDVTGYKCICDQGWKTNGQSPPCTVDVNECDDPKPHCSVDPMVQCINLRGTYTCGPCPTGFRGTGHYCADINECEQNNGGCSTAPSVPCINTHGSHHCGSCPIGWVGDGKTCTRNMESRCARGDICHYLAECFETATGAYCSCPNGYVGNGFGPYGCVRNDHDICAGSPCQNGGTCIARNATSYYCACPPGTNQPNCTVNNDPCAVNPCKNGGTCLGFGNSDFQCQCTRLYTGRTCTTERRTCGGVLSSPNGVLKYPDSETYPHNTICGWLIRTNITQVLNITFNQFKLEESTDCRFDWLQIHDGHSSASQIIGRYCGNKLPKGGNIITTRNTLYLFFRSDNTSAHDGFEFSWDSIDPVCGGEIEVTTHGTITSPGSPGHYPPNRDCVWHLVGPLTTRIEFHFFTMNLEIHSDCTADYLEIYSGDPNNAIEKFCNTSRPVPLTTASNEATLIFHSDGIGSDSGFQIHYTIVEGVPGCGGVFTTDQGEIASPVIDGVYPKGISCNYLIRFHKGNRILIQFRQFFLESDTSECYYDYVEMYEGATEDSPKIGRWCGRNMPPDYDSIGNVVLIHFRSDMTVSYEGFRLFYSLKCIETHTSPEGIIKSPSYPDEYPSDRNCIYEIEAPVGKAIALTFQDFNLEAGYNSYASGDCTYDYVEVYDGHDKNSTQLLRECGSRIPSMLVSTQNMMIINFQSDSSIHGRGFKANYSFIDSACGGIIRSLGQNIQPPMQYGSYTHNTQCKWTIIAPKNHAVQLTFQTFHLETSWRDNECAVDNVIVYDGLESSEFQIGKFCGRTIPPILTSNSQIMTIKFNSDSSISYEGFTATYNFINVSNMCSQSLRSLSGVIKSPNWPNPYSGENNCTWNILVESGHQIELNVIDFHLESHPRCYYDYLEIRNGPSEQSPLIGRYCSDTIPKQIRSFTNSLWLHFVTDLTQSYNGFNIEYHSSLTGCGGTMTSAMGSITSPNYPSPYSADTQCNWLISVNPGSVINMKITDLDMEEETDCSYDSVKFYDGRDASAKLIKTVCELSGFEEVSSTGNQLFIRMVSDVSNQGRGFQMEYESRCNRDLFQFYGIIETPNYPNIYPDNLQCEWKIIAPIGNQIKVAFSDFDLEHTRYYDTNMNEQRCHYDYVEIIDQRNQEIMNTTKVCNKSPNQFTSIGNIVVIKFVSDVSIAGRGFHLEYERQGCGGIYNHPSGEIKSPNYPKQFPQNINCSWTITTDVGKLIVLNFTDFDVHMEGTCDKHSFIVSTDHHLTNYTTIANICQKQLTSQFVITSHGHIVYITFQTNNKFSGRGFSLTYTTNYTKCGGIYQGSNFEIYSPNYPQNYPPNTVCEWNLKTDPSHAIEMKFIDFDLEETEDCDDDYVKVWDSLNSNNERTELLTKCGQLNANDPLFSRFFVSTKNDLQVTFQSDFMNEAKGFKALVQTKCGSHITVDESGHISTNGLNVIDDCEWNLVASNLDQHVTLTIIELDIGTINFANSDCNVNNSIFNTYDGDTKNSALKQSYCTGPFLPVTSNGNALTFVLKVPEMRQFNFQAHYTILDNSCGRTINSLGESIASPRYPQSYPLIIDCEWVIIASPGNQLLFSITNLDIEESENCNKDYLEIRETDESGKLLGAFCGKTVPSIFPPSNGIWMKFRSDSDVVGGGFLSEFQYAYDVEHSELSGTITSPKYPKATTIQQTMRHRIMIDLNSFIIIKISEVIGFMHERIDQNLQIYDGYNEFAEKLPNDLEDSIVSSTNVIYIVVEPFVKSYFKIEWSSIDKITHNTRIKDAANNGTETINCTSNSLITVKYEPILRFNISSPGYPNGYNNSIQCTWTLMPALPGFHVSLQFSAIDLEDVDNCIADYVEVQSSENNIDYNPTAYGKLCRSGQIKPYEKIHGNPYLRLTFNSDYYTNRTGFISYPLLECGGTLNGPNGFINKNMTLTNRSVNRTCIWEVHVRRGRRIKFTFDEISFPKLSSGVCDSYFLIRNGLEEDSPILGNGKLCEKTDSDIETSSNHATVLLNSGTQLQLNDFHLTYQEINNECGFTTELSNSLNTTYITSPHYPNIPDAHSECIWTLTAPNNEIIQIDFIEPFDLTTTENCEVEYVELRDGATEMARKIGQYCQSVPATIKTTSNMLRIKFFTDALVPRNGFKAKISIGQCGGYIRGPSGVITSSSGSSSSNSICEYRIYGTRGTTLNITFDEFRFGGSSYDYSYYSNYACNNTDRLELYNMYSDPNETLSLLSVYCSYNIPSGVIVTDTWEVLIKYINKNQNIDRGFRLSYNSMNERCGGYVQSESGIITSPGYPNGRSTHRLCEWRITVPKGRRIRVDILDFDVSIGTSTLNSSTPSGLIYRIGFYNDHTYMTRIRHLNTDNFVEPIRSSDNKMLISMWMPSNVGHRGVKLNFTSSEETICRGNFNDVANSFNTPLAGSPIYCEYYRDSTLPFFEDEPLIGTLAIQVQPINGTNIRYSSIVFRYTEKHRDKYITWNSLTNTANMILIMTPFTESVLKFRNMQMLPLQYVINYKIHKCGGVLPGSPETRIVKPSLMLTNVVGQVDCAWQLAKTSESSKLIVNITYTKLDCAHEHLTIYKGDSPLSPVIPRICGEQSTVAIEVGVNGMFVEYHVDNFNLSNSTFEIATELAEGRCGGRLEDPVFIFQSPGNVSGYPNNMECIWHIKAPIGYHVSLEANGRFFIEDSPNCTADYLEVHTLINDEWKSFGRYCGRTLPGPFNTSSSELKVTFRSNSAITGDGFKLRWRKHCGGVFTAKPEVQYLTSPRYPASYDKKLNCNYTIITAAADKKISLKFTDFELEDTSRGCQFDNVSIYRNKMYYNPPQTELIGTYCFANYPEYFRESNRIMLIFKTDQWIERKGFKFEYSLDNCGGVITNSTQISFPKANHDPQRYESFDCKWNITAPADQNIIIVIEQFAMSGAKGCYQDSVSIYEGAEIQEDRRRAKLCGNLTASVPVLSINGSEAIIQATYYVYMSSPKFSALIIFSKKCDRSIELTDLNPNYTLDETRSSTQYDVRLDCHYTITAPVGKVISATFEQFHVAPCTNNETLCTCDFIEIRDGISPMAELVLDKYCGHTTPRDIFSTRNGLFMRFKTDSVGSSTGFRVKFQLESPVCGQSLYNMNDTYNHVQIKSPGSPTYPPNTRCEWILEAPYSEIFDIYFDRLDIDEVTVHGENLGCRGDYVELIDDTVGDIIVEGYGQGLVYSGPQSQANVYFYQGTSSPVAPHRYCGQSVPVHYYSAGNKVAIRFVSDQSVETRGFELTAKLSRSCNRNYTALQGRLKSVKSEDCQTYITVPDNYTITIYFSQISYYVNSFECTNITAPIIIYDAKNNNKLLTYLCPQTRPDPLFSNTSSLLITFKQLSIGWTPSTGLYDMIYLATDQGVGCGGHLFNYGGKFTSPMYPLNDRTNSLCTWRITAPNNLKVALLFEIFDMGSPKTCSDNYLEIIEPLTSGAMGETRKYCGDDRPAPYKSKSRDLYIRFKKTVNFSGTGWIINFMAVHEDYQPQAF